MNISIIMISCDTFVTLMNSNMLHYEEMNNTTITMISRVTCVSIYLLIYLSDGCPGVSGDGLWTQAPLLPGPVCYFTDVFIIVSTDVVVLGFLRCTKYVATNAFICCGHSYVLFFGRQVDQIFFFSKF